MITNEHLPEDILLEKKNVSKTQEEDFSLLKADLKEIRQETEKEMILRVLEETKYRREPCIVPPLTGYVPGLII